MAGAARLVRVWALARRLAGRARAPPSTHTATNSAERAGGGLRGAGIGPWV